MCKAAWAALLAARRSAEDTARAPVAAPRRRVGSSGRPLRSLPPPHATMWTAVPCRWSRCPPPPRGSTARGALGEAAGLGSVFFCFVPDSLDDRRGRWGPSLASVAQMGEGDASQPGNHCRVGAEGLDVSEVGPNFRPQITFNGLYYHSIFLKKKNFSIRLTTGSVQHPEETGPI